MKFVEIIRSMRRRSTKVREDIADPANSVAASIERMADDLKETLDHLRRSLLESFDNQSTASNLRLDGLTEGLKERMNGLGRGLQESFDNQSAANNLQLDRLRDDLNERVDDLRRDLRESSDNQSTASNLRLDRLRSDLAETMDGLCRDLRERFDKQSTASNLRLDRVIKAFEQHTTHLTNRLDELIDRQKSQERTVWRLRRGSGERNVLGKGSRVAPRPDRSDRMDTRLPRTIWCLWLQGWEHAPDLIKACGDSWRVHNPDWTIHHLDLDTATAWLSPSGELERILVQGLPREALSDVIRIELLKRFGGVWVDSTVYCLQPLDEWIDAATPAGFFAFSRPGPDRMLSTWFLAAERGSHVIDVWRRKTLAYWQDRAERDHYFWFHYLFAEGYESDAQFRDVWDKTPKVSADGPHAYASGEDQLFRAVVDADRLLVETPRFPVLKLTHKVDHHKNDAGTVYRWLCDRVMNKLTHGNAVLAAEERARQGTALSARVASVPHSNEWRALQTNDSAGALWSPERVTVGSLKASSENLGDYIQIIAAQRLLDEMQLQPSVYVDRDTELSSSPALQTCSGRLVLPMNGWFKHKIGGDAQWPPHPKILPVFIGFHLRPHQCPELLAPESIAYMKAHGPIGCRDPFTVGILAERGVPAYLSHCLSLTFPARDPHERGDTVVVASHNTEILQLIPARYRSGHVYVNHHIRKDGFDAYLAEARALLEFYRTRARLVITTFLHCALPCIAMGIPVVVFLPKPRDGLQKISDEERFSGLMQIAAVHRFEDASAVDWTPRPVDVAALQNEIVRDFRHRMRAAVGILQNVVANGPSSGDQRPITMWPDKARGRHELH